MKPLTHGLWLLCLLALAPCAQAGTKYYFYTNAQGTPLAKADGAGTIVERYDYTPYGVPLQGAGPDGPGYTSHVNDPETGLVYMQQRYYDPRLGVFLSVDPVTAYDNPIGQFHRYRYANSSPIRFTDPDGKESSELTLRGIEAIRSSQSDMSQEDARKGLLMASIIYSGGTASIGFRGLAFGIRALGTFLQTPSSAQRVNRLLKNVPEWKQTKGPSRIGERSGGSAQARSDFKQLKLDGVKDIKNKNGDVIGSTGKTSDGRQVTVREVSTDGRPTLEIRRQSGRGEEIRYNEPN